MDLEGQDLADLLNSNSSPWALSGIFDINHVDYLPTPWLTQEQATLPDNQTTSAGPDSVNIPSEYPAGFGTPDFLDLDDTDGELQARDEAPLPFNSDDAFDLLAAENSTPETAQARRSRRPKARGPSDLAWATQKPNIRRLYMEEDNTLEETRAIMKTKHNFDATTQMYKDKFADWRFVKNISRRTAGKLSRIAEERRPKDTKFYLGPKTWSADEIKRKYEKGGKGDNPSNSGSPLPAGLHWRTPSISPNLQNAIMRRSSNIMSDNPQLHMRPNLTGPSRPWTPNLSSPVISHGRPWTPNLSSPVISHGRPWSPFISYQARSLPTTWSQSLNQNSLSHKLPAVSPTQFPWQAQSLSRESDVGSQAHSALFLTPNWNGKSLSDLQSMRLDAMKLESQGKTSESIEKLRTAVMGFQQLLAPTHSFTETAIYDLVEILARNNIMDEVNALLNWLSDSFVKKYSLHNDKTLGHYIKVVRFLHKWSRHDDAKLLMYKVTELWATEDETMTPKVAISSSDVRIPTDLLETDINDLFPDPDCEDDVKIQLQLAKVMIFSRGDMISGVEDIIRKLIVYCDTNQLFATLIQARCCLFNFYKKKNMESLARETLDASLPIIEQRLNLSGSHQRSVLQISRELAFLYHDEGHISKCDEALEMMAECLESNARLIRDSEEVVSFLMSVAMEWHKRTHWELAIPWFERALAKSMQGLGKSHIKTRTLERTLAEGRFVLDTKYILEMETLFSD